MERFKNEGLSDYQFCGAREIDAFCRFQNCHEFVGAAIEASDGKMSVNGTLKTRMK